MEQERATIAVRAQPMDCHFSPQGHLLAAGLVDGRVTAFDADGVDSPPREVLTLKAHADSCRAVRFSATSNLLLTASSDRSILAVDVATSAPVARKSQAHHAPINRLISLSETTLASGDDDGGIKTWDTRQKGACCHLEHHTDFVADFALHEPDQCLVSVSGDGTLSVTDLRKMKLRARSEGDEDELLSVAVVKGGRKVAAGSQSGVLSLYSWGYFADCSDRFPVPRKCARPGAASVDCLAAANGDTLVAGCSDGRLLALGVLPNRMLGCLGEHGGFPIERLALAAGGGLLATASHDAVVRLWDVAALTALGGGARAEDTGGAPVVAEGRLSPNTSISGSENDTPQPRKARKGKTASASKSHKGSAAPNNFFADLL